MDDCLVWVDLEMTGLDVNTEHIIEMAVIITDKNLNIIAEGPDIIINQPDSILDTMGEWCQKHHSKSGLTQSVKSSHISLQDCEREMLQFIRKHTSKGKSFLAGNSVHADKEFLKKYMPSFLDHLHYRIIDVSTIKELVRAWYPTEFSNVPRKKLKHRALADIKDSIEELRFYRSAVFKN